MSDGVKEWVRLSRGHNGQKVVTVTLQDNNITVKYATRAFTSVKSGVVEARREGHKALDELREAVSE